MPTYQYTCTDCGHDLEAVQKFTDDALVECPGCTGKLRKVFSAVGVVFKGSGFYRTDSRAKSASPAAASPSDKAKANSEHTSPVGKDSSPSSASSDKRSSDKRSSDKGSSASGSSGKKSESAA